MNSQGEGFSEDTPPIPNLEDLADPDEIATYLRMSKSSLMALRFKDPAIPYIRFGNAVYFSKTQITWWLNTYQVVSKRRFDVRRQLQRNAAVKMNNKRKGK